MDNKEKVRKTIYGKLESGKHASKVLYQMTCLDRIQ